MVKPKNRHKNARNAKNTHGDTYESPFDTHVRIRHEQLEYLKETRVNYSIAGYLDMIINFWRDYEINFGISEPGKDKKKTKG